MVGDYSLVEPSFLSQALYAVTGGVLEIFTIFTGKHLCWSLFLRRLQVFRPSGVLIVKFEHISHLILVNNDGLGKQSDYYRRRDQ